MSIAKDGEGTYTHVTVAILNGLQLYLLSHMIKHKDQHEKASIHSIVSDRHDL